MSDKQINIAFGANTEKLESGLTEATNMLKGASDKMSQAAAGAAEKTEFAFRNLQQAYRTTSKDAQYLAATLGTDSQAFQDAARKAAAYKDELDDVNDALKAASPEQRWRLVGSAIGAAVDMAQGFVGVLSLVGIEANNAQKYIQALMSLEAISGAVNAVFTLTDAYKALTASIVASGTAATASWAAMIKPLTIAAGVLTALGFTIESAGKGSTTGAFKGIDELGISDKFKKTKETKEPKAPKVKAEKEAEITAPKWWKPDLGIEEIATKSGLALKGLEESMLSVGKVGQESFVKISDSVSSFGLIMGDIFENVAQQLQALAVNGFAQFGEMIGESLAGAEVDAGAAASQILAGIASTLGQGMIAMGLPMLFAGVTAGQGAALIAGGTALMAVAGALKANSRPSSSSGGGGSYGGTSYAGGGSIGGTYAPSAVTVMIDGRIRGGDIVITQLMTDRKNKRVK